MLLGVHTLATCLPVAAVEMNSSSHFTQVDVVPGSGTSGVAVGASQSGRFSLGTLIHGTVSIWLCLRRGVKQEGPLLPVSPKLQVHIFQSIVWHVFCLSAAIYAFFFIHPMVSANIFLYSHVQRSGACTYTTHVVFSQGDTSATNWFLPLSVCVLYWIWSSLMQHAVVCYLWCAFELYFEILILFCRPSSEISFFHFPAWRT